MNGWYSSHLIQKETSNNWKYIEKYEIQRVELFLPTILIW